MGGWNRSPPGSAGVGELEASQQLIHAAQISLPVIFCHLSRETGAFWELGGAWQGPTQPHTLREGSSMAGSTFPGPAAHQTCPRLGSGHGQRLPCPVASTSREQDGAQPPAPPITPH